MDVCFQQCHANFPHGLVHIRLREASVPAQIIENGVEAVC
jgi:hypothetical protein